MTIKINKEFKRTFFIIFSLFVSMKLEIWRPVLLALIVFSLFLSEKTNKNIVERKKFNSISSFCKYIVIILCVFCMIQIIFLRFSIKNVSEDLGILSCIFIGFIIGAIGLKTYQSYEAFLKAIMAFMIIFSLYYILDIMMNGLPEGRNSALGNVSSNFCATVLYLNYPAILYYLFGREKELERFIKNECYIALILSMIVIMTSGSRTAMGAVILMITQMAFFKQDGLKNKLKYIMIVIVGLFAIWIAYTYIVSIRELIDRALDVLEGKNVLNSNVRQLIWTSALQQFMNGNHVLGSGSSIVRAFERSAHNLFYEVLLCSGYLGTAIFIISTIVLLILILKNQKYKQRFFSIMLLISGIIITMVQPFYSTSYTCGLMLWMSLFAFMFDARRL